ncbi:MAG: rRNA methyltransferase, partial [Deltaproteobacteria bacterium]
LYVFTRAFRKACIRAAIYAVFFIFGLLLLTFRSIVNSLLAMIPLIVGTLWTTGLMWCLGVDFNLANSLFLPLIVGAGVEYGIVILNRWFQEKRNFKGLPLSTGKGIILAALTTTVGFGSLMISHHRGIYSLGMLATIGSIAVMTSAVVVLPAILYLCLRKTKHEVGEIIVAEVNIR